MRKAWVAVPALAALAAAVLLHARAAPPPMDMRAQIRQAVKSEVAPLKTAADLDRYLGELEARARNHRKVTALEVEPGIAAIQQLAATLGAAQAQEKQAAFIEKMARLSAEYDRPQPT